MSVESLTTTVLDMTERRESTATTTTATAEAEAATVPNTNNTATTIPQSTTSPKAPPKNSRRAKQSLTLSPAAIATTTTTTTMTAAAAAATDSAEGQPVPSQSPHTSATTPRRGKSWVLQTDVSQAGLSVSAGAESSSSSASTPLSRAAATVSGSADKAPSKLRNSSAKVRVSSSQGSDGSSTQKARQSAKRKANVQSETDDFTEDPLMPTAVPSPAAATTTTTTSRAKKEAGSGGRSRRRAGAASSSEDRHHSLDASVEAKNATNTNLFIRNLAATVTQTQLTELFAQYGVIVSSAIMRHIHTGESLGVAFVRYDTHDEARKAMSALCGSKFEGKVLAVQWAKKPDGAPVGEARKKIMKLFVRNIPLDVSVERLQELFGRYGPISQVTIHKDTAPVDDKRLERHIAFVIYSSEGAAEVAAEAVHNSRPFESCGSVPLMVKLAEDNYNKHERKGTSASGIPPTGNVPPHALSSSQPPQPQHQSSGVPSSMEHAAASAMGGFIAPYMPHFLSSSSSNTVPIPAPHSACGAAGASMNAISTSVGGMGLGATSAASIGSMAVVSTSGAALSDAVDATERGDRSSSVVTPLAPSSATDEPLIRSASMTPTHVPPPLPQSQQLQSAMNAPHRATPQAPLATGPSYAPTSGKSAIAGPTFGSPRPPSTPGAFPTAMMRMPYSTNNTTSDANSMNGSTLNTSMSGTGAAHLCNHSNPSPSASGVFASTNAPAGSSSFASYVAPSAISGPLPLSASFPLHAAASPMSPFAAGSGAGVMECKGMTSSSSPVPVPLMQPLMPFNGCSAGPSPSSHADYLSSPTPSSNAMRPSTAPNSSSMYPRNNVVRPPRVMVPLPPLSPTVPTVPSPMLSSPFTYATAGGGAALQQPATFVSPTHGPTSPMGGFNGVTMSGPQSGGASNPHVPLPRTLSSRVTQSSDGSSCMIPCPRSSQLMAAAAAAKAAEKEAAQRAAAAAAAAMATTVTSVSAVLSLSPPQQSTTATTDGSSGSSNAEWSKPTVRTYRHNPYSMSGARVLCQ